MADQHGLASVQNNILKYAENTKASSSDYMQVDSTIGQDITQKLQNVLLTLNDHLKSLQTELQAYNDHAQQLQSITSPAEQPAERLKQLRVIKQAYDDLTDSKPPLPDPTSSTPLLIAANNLNQSLLDTKSAVTIAEDGLDSVENQARTEEASLSDAQLLVQTIQNRTATLENVKKERSSQPPHQRARQLLKARNGLQQGIESHLQSLARASEEFAWDHLSSMFAAEELGGPVVGELSDVNDDMLTAGFSSQGKPKRQSQSGLSSNKRQKRIDEIWTNASSEPGSERNAAHTEWTELITELYEAWRGNRETGVYVMLSRDSAASRFLVRAKVAQYHPKDARRLRLIDFGREVQHS